MKEKTYS